MRGSMKYGDSKSTISERRAVIDGDNSLSVGIVTFGNLADELKKYHSGSMIRITGKSVGVAVTAMKRYMMFQ
jgi:hypothetical protein